MFSEFQLNVTPGSTKMGTPILVGDPQKWGFHKNDEFFIFTEFFTRKFLFSIKKRSRACKLCKMTSQIEKFSLWPQTDRQTDAIQ